MSLPTTKELKKLADTCRKAGIKSFKNADFEFTLSDQGPISNYKKRTKAISEPKSQDNSIVTDSLTEEQLLMWSVAEIDQEQAQ